MTGASDLTFRVHFSVRCSSRPQRTSSPAEPGSVRRKPLLSPPRCLPDRASRVDAGCALRWLKGVVFFAIPTRPALFRFPLGKRRETLRTTSISHTTRRVLFSQRRYQYFRLRHQMATTITSIRQPVISSLIEFVFGADFSISSFYASRTSVSTAYSLEFYFLRGIILYYFGQYNGAVRDFSMVLRMDWRHRGAAAWIAKAERASCRVARG